MFPDNILLAVDFVLSLWCIFLIVYLVYFFQLLIAGRKAPFVPLPREVIPAVREALALDEGSVLFDLGCGEGRILIECCRAQPMARYVGIDLGWWPTVLARWRSRSFSTGRSITILCGDILLTDVSSATHVFTYLFPDLMNELLPKLTKELRPGTRLVSCDFYFSEKKPSRVIDLNRDERKRAQRLYVYEF